MHATADKRMKTLEARARRDLMYKNRTAGDGLAIVSCAWFCCKKRQKEENCGKIRRRHEEHPCLLVWIRKDMVLRK